MKLFFCNLQKSEMCGKCLQTAEMFSDQGYNNRLADEIRWWKDPCEAPFSLPLLSVILFVPRGSWRRGIAMPQAFGILVSAE